MATDSFRLLKAGASRSLLVLAVALFDVCHDQCFVVHIVPKETPSGSDDLLEHYGLSGIYKLFTVRGHDTYLKGLPADSEFRRYKQEPIPGVLQHILRVGIALPGHTRTRSDHV